MWYGIKPVKYNEKSCRQVLVLCLRLSTEVNKSVLLHICSGNIDITVSYPAANTSSTKDTLTVKLSSKTGSAQLPFFFGLHFY